jgi:PAP2 superfamily
MRSLAHSVGVACVVLSAGLFAAAPARADVITVWNEQAFVAGGASRTLAMVHIAMFDAINAIHPRYRPYLRLPRPPSNASAEAAVASAAHGVLVRLFPGQAAAFDAVLEACLARLPHHGTSAGVEYGDVVAQTIYDARLADNILTPGPLYVSGTTPGVYRLTTPGPPQPINANAPNWIPFAMASASQFRPERPPALTSKKYARDVNEVLALGGLSNWYRSPLDDQAAQWHTETPQFPTNRVARAETATDGRSLLAHARLFALLNITIADAATSVFDAKYTYLFWRPVTAIRNADADDNPRTTLDADWSPFLVTPPHPEYPAAHAVIQTAAVEVLKQYFGRHYAFDTTSPTVPGVTRHYQNFDAWVEEGGLARIHGGMHFRNSVDVGDREGSLVANWILKRYLTAIED